MIPTGKNGFVWWPCEYDAPADMTDREVIEEICEVLAEDGVIHLIKLETYMGSDGVRKITARLPVVLSKAMVGTITPLHTELKEE